MLQSFANLNLHYDKKRSKGILHFRSTKTDFHFLKKGWLFRLPLLLDSSLRSVAIAIIGGYQCHISPKKGYSCAHRIVYGGDSCSQYVKKTLMDKSLFEATILARQRFNECNIAYTSSKNQVVRSNGLGMVSVVYDDPTGCIVGIITAILALICGKNNRCC